MEQNRTVIVGVDVVKGLANGVNTLANLVKVTLGPKGQNVIIQKSLGPEIVNDGVTIARSVFLKDPLENMGAQMMKQISLNTEAAAGDGTTTSTILGQSIVNSGIELIGDDKINLIVFKKEMELIADDVCNFLIEQTRSVNNDEDIFNIAKISSNNDLEIAQVLVDAYKEVGKDGYITVRDPKTLETTFEVAKGLVYDRGFLSKFFVNDRKNSVNSFRAIDCLVVFVHGDLESAQEVIPLIEIAAEEQKSLFIIADNIKSDAMNCLVSNKLAGFDVCAVNSPGIASEHIHIMNDIISYTGGVILNENGGKSIYNATIEDFGVCESVEVYMENMIIKVEKPNQEMVDARVEDIKLLMDKTKEPYFLDMYQTRLAKLQGGIAVIYPGGRSDIEIIEKKLRVEDAIKAMKAALEMGFLPGGGTAFVHAATYLKLKSLHEVGAERIIAYNIMIQTLYTPFIQIVLNCGLDPSELINKFISYDFWHGYDAKENEFTNMYKAGIIDPTKVSVNALKNAVSVSTNILTSGGAIILEGSAEEERSPLFGR